MKKIFACNGNIVNDDKYGKVIQLQGDHRDKVVEWIYKNNITTPEEGRIIVMGA
jgi:translation initiation factor 1